MSNCFKQTAVVGCYTNTSGETSNVVIHYTYDDAGAPAVRITDLLGTLISAADLTNTIVGACGANELECNITREQISLADGVPVTIHADDNVVGWNVNFDATTTLTIDGVLIEGSDSTLAKGECYGYELSTSIPIQVDGGTGTLTITRKICA